VATSRSFLLSLEARGKLAGLSASHHRNLGQLVRLITTPFDPSSPKQLIARSRHALLTQAWHDHLANPPNVYAWDRLRRYRSRPGTAYSEYLHDSLIAFLAAPVWTIYDPGVTRVPIPGRLVFSLYTLDPILLAQVDYGPTPVFPIRTARIYHWSGPLWLGNYPDEWPTARVFCRFRAVQPFGNIDMAFTGLAATTTHG